MQLNLHLTACSPPSSRGLADKLLMGMRMRVQNSSPVNVECALFSRTETSRVGAKLLFTPPLLITWQSRIVKC